MSQIDWNQLTNLSCSSEANDIKDLCKMEEDFDRESQFKILPEEQLTSVHPEELMCRSDDDMSSLLDADRKFPCYFCEKRFKKRSHLNGHILIHKLQETGVAKFACNICDKQFVHKGHYNVHMRNHTG